jgi:hypothetical protein
MDDQPPAISDVQKVAGGVEIEVTYEDGTKEFVKVRQIKIIKEFDAYLRAQDDESAEVELVCSKPKGWAETLTAESFDAVAEKSQELNLPLFRNRYRRLQARSEAMNPGFMGKAIRDVLAKARGASPEAAG